MEYEYGFSVKNSVNDNPDMFIAHRDTSNYHFEQVEACLSAQVNVGESPLGNLYEWREIREQEPDCYWYHPDHLGSSSWITYSDGSAVQHLHYFPWGEDFVDQRNTSFSSMYTFSAKEKDTETGYSYFGSRYYNSDLSIWLSVDPMSDKYPHQSNYVYCSNNPIRVIDPNGEDEYEFDECGYYVRTITNTNADIIHIVNGDGKRIASSQEFSYGSIVSQPENAIPSNNTKLSDATMFQVSNEETAGGMFEFFASNTPVEWCVVSAESQNGECEYMIGTNHDEEHNNINSIITNRGFMIERSAHNHPNDINSVSKGDHKNAYILERLNPNVQLYNFTKSNGYTRYTYRDGFVDDKGNSHFPTLMEIEVFDEKKNR